MRKVTSASSDVLVYGRQGSVSPHMDEKTRFLGALSLTGEEGMIYYMRLRPFVWL